VRHVPIPTTGTLNPLRPSARVSMTQFRTAGALVAPSGVG
jgi:hypothetical protein